MSNAALVNAGSNATNQPTSRPGMGANLIPGGCAFRVWAPHVEAISVVGEFNDWNVEAHHLAPEGFGYWSGEVPGAEYRDEYKYIIFHEGRIHYRNDPYARELTNSNGNSVIIDPTFDWGDTSNYQTPPWHEWIIYEMHIGTFHDTSDERPGNFDRAIERLDHLVDLGINAIEIMPSAEFPGENSWGYNTAHQFAIERDYGGPKAFRRFIKAAHERGLAVVLDVVYNHFGPMDIDLWQFDGWHAEGHEGGIYVYAPDGRLPARTEAAQQRARTLGIASRRRSADGPEDRERYERCIMGRTVPLIAVAPNRLAQIFQTPDHVIILHEQNWDFRVIRLDGGQRLAEPIRQWQGDSRGPGTAIPSSSTPPTSTASGR